MARREATPASAPARGGRKAAPARGGRKEAGGGTAAASTADASTASKS